MDDPLIIKVGKLVRGQPSRRHQPPPYTPGSENLALPGQPQLAFTTEEQAIVDHINAARQGIKDLNLRANKAELDHAVHTLQMFVVAHALQRIGFAGLSRWYWRD